MKITIFDFVNHIIHNHHEVHSIHVLPDDSDKEYKEELYKMEISFFVVGKEVIRVFLKEDFNNDH